MHPKHIATSLSHSIDTLFETLSKTPWTECVSILRTQPHLIHLKNKQSKTLLIIAVQQQDLKKIEGLKQLGASLSEKDKLNRTPAHYAIMTENPDVLHALGDIPKEALEKDKFGLIPLAIAAEMGLEILFNHLLPITPDLSVTNEQNETLLHAAARGQNLNIASTLALEHALKWDDKNHHNQTPFHIVLSQDHKENWNNWIDLIQKSKYSVNFNSTEERLHLAKACKRILKDREPELPVLQTLADEGIQHYPIYPPQLLIIKTWMIISAVPKLNKLIPITAINANFEEKLKKLHTTLYLLPQLKPDSIQTFCRQSLSDSSFSTHRNLFLITFLAGISEALDDDKLDQNKAKIALLPVFDRLLNEFDFNASENRLARFFLTMFVERRPSPKDKTEPICEISWYLTQKLPNFNYSAFIESSKRNEPGPKAIQYFIDHVYACETHTVTQDETERIARLMTKDPFNREACFRHLETLPLLARNTLFSGLISRFTSENDRQLSLAKQLANSLKGKARKIANRVIKEAEQNTSLSLNHEPNPLFQSASNGTWEDCKRILDANPDLLNSQDENGNTALGLAAFYGKSDIVSGLLQHPTASITLLNYRGQSPIHMAVMGGNLECLTQLTETAPPKSYTPDFEGMTPIHIAIQESIQEQNIPLYFHLCEKNPDFTKTAIDGESVVHAAARLTTPTIIQNLIDVQKLDLTQPIPGSNISPFHIAIGFQNKPKNPMLQFFFDRNIKLDWGRSRDLNILGESAAHILLEKNPELNLASLSKEAVWHHSKNPTALLILKKYLVTSNSLLHLFIPLPTISSCLPKPLAYIINSLVLLPNFSEEKIASFPLPDHTIHPNEKGIKLIAFLTGIIMSQNQITEKKETRLIEILDHLFQDFVPMPQTHPGTFFFLSDYLDDLPDKTITPQFNIALLEHLAKMEPEKFAYSAFRTAVKREKPIETCLRFLILHLNSPAAKPLSTQDMTPFLSAAIQDPTYAKKQFSLLQAITNTPLQQHLIKSIVTQLISQNQLELAKFGLPFLSKKGKATISKQIEEKKRDIQRAQLEEEIKRKEEEEAKPFYAQTDIPTAIQHIKTFPERFESDLEKLTPKKTTLIPRKTRLFLSELRQKLAVEAEHYAKAEQINNILPEGQRAFMNGVGIPTLKKRRKKLVPPSPQTDRETPSSPTRPQSQ